MSYEECDKKMWVGGGTLLCHRRDGHIGDHYDDDIGVSWCTTDERERQFEVQFNREGI